MRRLALIAALFTMVVAIVGCSADKSGNHAQNSSTTSTTVKQKMKLPALVEWEGHTFAKTDRIYKEGSIELKELGTYKGHTVYEIQEIGYNEKFIKNDEGDFVLYEIEGMLLRKPNIYLYPEQEEMVEVRVEPAGRITVSIPECGDGWRVSVSPSGRIDGTYDYLYYEAAIDYPFTLDRGWVVNKTSFSDRVDTILARIGLNERERIDFIEYWGKELAWEKDAYAMYYLLPEEIDEAVKLTVNKRPDSLLRAYFYFVPVDNGTKLREPVVPSFDRNGFTVVEWGGLGE